MRVTLLRIFVVVDMIYCCAIALVVWRDKGASVVVLTRRGSFVILYVYWCRESLL